MLVGHFGVGLAAKRIAPKVSVGTLVMAAVFADLLFWPFVLLGIEHVRIQPGITTTNALDLYDIPFSHSLLMDILWAALLGAAYFLRHRYPRGAWVVFIAVLSHWLLDFVSHRPDMPIAPGLHMYLGLGLYNSRLGVLMVEGLLWILGVILYVRATRAKSRAGVWCFWGMVVLLTMLWLSTLAGIPPSNLRAAGISSLIFFCCVVAWAYWMNRARPVKAAENV